MKSNSTYQCHIEGLDPALTRCQQLTEVRKNDTLLIWRQRYRGDDLPVDLKSISASVQGSPDKAVLLGVARTTPLGEIELGVEQAAITA